VNMLVTTEGVYPPWSDSVELSFVTPHSVNDLILLQSDIVLQFPSDFIDFYSYVESGSATFSPLRGEAMLNLKFKDSELNKARLNGAYQVKK
jgi:hypothetical protein